MKQFGKPAKTIDELINLCEKRGLACGGGAVSRLEILALKIWPGKTAR